MVTQQDADRNAQEKSKELEHNDGSFSISHSDHASMENGKKRLRGGGWVTAPFIFGCEAAERLAITGSHANLITYLVQQMHMQTLNAASLLNTFAGTSMLTPLLGAFVADAYLGRFATIAGASVIYLVGLLILTTTAVTKSLRPEPCANVAQSNAGTCDMASSIQMGVIYLSFALMALGSGGIRPCVSPFGASQFDQNDERENKQLKHYFNWYYISVTVAGLLAATVIVYIQDNVGWGLGFGIPTVVMLFSVFCFYGGTSLYRYSPPQGSPFTRMAQVIVAAFRKRNLAHLENPDFLYDGTSIFAAKALSSRSPTKEFDGEDDFRMNPKLQPETYEKKSFELGASNELKLAGPRGENFVGGQEKAGSSMLKHSNQFRFLDKAAIEVESDTQFSLGQEGHVLTRSVNPWTLCTVQQVEELKCVLRLGPMWATSIPLSLSITQQATYTVRQAMTMDRHLGSFVIPSASMHTISIITVLIWLPFYDKVVIRCLKRVTGNERGISFFAKIGVGLALLVVAMIVTTLVEHKRRAAAWHYGFVDRPNDMIPISAFWLTPQFVIGGLSESFMMVGHLEFFYHMVPEHMTSTGAALFMTSLAVGSNLSSVLLDVVQKVTRKPGRPGWLDNNINKAHLDYFYALLTIMLSLDLVFYLFVARWYTKQKNHMDVIHGQTDPATKLNEVIKFQTMVE